MDSHIVLFLGVEDLGDFAIRGDEYTLVADLTTHLGIEGCLLKHNLEVFFTLLFDLAIFEDLGGGFKLVIADEGLVALVHLHPVGGLDRGGTACTLFLCLHILIKFLLIDCHTLLAEDQLCQVKRESVGVVEVKCIGTRDARLALCFSLLDD